MNMPISARVIDLPLDLIDMGERLRPIDRAELAKIRISLRERGQLQPIRVRQADTAGRHQLIAGAHRVEGAREEGWTTIKAILSTATTDEEARLEEIDENLCRHELNPLDRAIFLARRQKLYEELHPETGHGGDRRKASGHDGHLKAPAFYEDVANRTGISGRTVRRCLTLAKDLAPDAVALLRGTTLATKQSELEALRAVPADKQAAVVRLALQNEVGVARARRDVLQEKIPLNTDAAYARMVALFEKKASPKERRDFVAWLVKGGHLEAYGVERTAQPAKKGAR